MKPRTYFGFALLFPYLLWGVCALVAVSLSSGQELPEAWNIALMPVFFYAFGIILWFIPYTVLAIGLWLLSRNKPTRALYQMALISPLLLSVLMLLEATLVSLPAEDLAKLTKDLVDQLAVLGGFSLVFGYLCVVIALGGFKLLQARKLIAEEMPMEA
jgi:hypothetical protein